MSWLARSLSTSLKIPDDSGADDDPDTAATTTSSSSTRIPPPPPLPPPHSAAAEGVKEDLSELSKTLTRQFWGVANFLAPPPGETSPPPAASPRDRVDTPPEIVGIRSDFAEIGGRFRTGISRISKHKAVSGFSKMASNFFAPDDEEEEVVKVASGKVGEEKREEIMHEVDDAEESEEERVRREVENDGVRHDEEEVSHELEEESLRHEEKEVEEDWDVIGITDEVLAFARNISRHPETWLDFPLLPDEEESDGLFSCNLFIPCSLRAITSKLKKSSVLQS